MSEKTRLSVTVVDDSADPQGLHEATSWLRDELLHLDVVVSADGTDPAPAGARADLALTLGGLVIALTGTEVLGSIVGAITAWLGRNQHRSVKLELDGDVLEVTGVRSDQQRELIDAWLRRRQTDASPASGRRLALIVAGDEYRDPGLRRLRAPAQDAEALARVLGDESIGGFDVRTLLNESTSVVNEAVEEFFSPTGILTICSCCISPGMASKKTTAAICTSPPPRRNCIGSARLRSRPSSSTGRCPAADAGAWCFCSTVVTRAPSLAGHFRGQARLSMSKTNSAVGVVS
ncbi:hypothetical protein GCM10020001_023680 [Nonomuraea salmonea]